jgi:hypothetical protein
VLSTVRRDVEDSWITRRGRKGGAGRDGGVARVGGRGPRQADGLAARSRSNRPAERPPDDVDDLIHVAVRIAVLGSRSNAALDVVLEDEHRERVHRGPKGGCLLEDVDAVLLALDHPGDAADLALDAGEAPDQLRLVLRVAVPEVVGVGLGHARMIPPGGITGQAGPRRASSGPNGYTPFRMDPLDHLGTRLDGHRCSVCDAAVPADRVRLLAWREDLAFLELDCGDCLSTTLGFEMVSQALAEGHPAPRAPISSDDVLDMHQLLATWRGDLTGLLSGEERGRVESSR